MENSSALESSFCLVAEHQFPNIKFSADAVTRTSELCLDAGKQAVIQICKKLTYKGRNKNEIKQLYDSFFGELNSFHPFRFANQIGFDATEVQITKGIVHFINPEIQGEKGKNRLVAFLYALLPSDLEKKHNINGINLSLAHSFKVDSEYLLPDKQRLDIVIRWRCKNLESMEDEDFIVIIEAKFFHHLTEKQLIPYEDAIKNVFQVNEKNSRLVLLTLNGQEAPEDNKKWQSKTWMSVMACWEHKLTEDNEIGFSFLRQFIWNKLRC